MYPLIPATIYMYDFNHFSTQKHYVETALSPASQCAIL